MHFVIKEKILIDLLLHELYVIHYYQKNTIRLVDS